MMIKSILLSLALIVTAALGHVSEDEASCWVAGYCQNGQLLKLQKVATARDCLLECSILNGCQWFTYHSSSSNCLLFDACPSLDETCEDCISGEAACVDDETEPFWHMIIGGFSGFHKMSSVELFNWLTGEQCFLKDLPIEIMDHSAVILDGTPVFCGGLENYHTINKCFAYNKETQTWDEFSGLIEPVYKGSSVLVPNHGWHIFGGGSMLNITQAQRLESLDSEWTLGPELYQEYMFAKCAVQYHENKTVFFGLGSDSRDIVTFDWETMTYNKEPLRLSGARQRSTCALLKGIHDEPLVAVAGGIYKGMEVWNPRDGFVETVTPELPAEYGATDGIGDARLVPIKDGSEAILYGGERRGSGIMHQPGIWKFRVVDHSWTRVGSMLRARYSHQVLPVTGITCPK